MIEDMITIVLKELLELEITKKKFFILIGFIFLPLICVIYSVFVTNARSLLALNQLFIFIPLIVSIGISSQMSFTSILEEKRFNTIENLLSTNVSKSAILIGKVIPPSIMGYIISLISFLILFIFNIIFNVTDITKYYLLMIISPLILSYISSCVTILVTMIIQDEKMAPLVSNIPILLLIYIIAKLTIKIQSTLFIIILILLIASCITFISVIIFKKVNFIIKI